MSQAELKIQKKLEQQYDETPYESHAYYKTHPDHLYFLGRIHGLTPPDYKTARVLELGCAGGGNLGPFAYSFPDSKCVGIDISEEEINTAKLFKDKLNINNVEFSRRDIMDITRKKDGEFDYIIVHGILSWVPETVQTKIFEICREVLSPHGMAMISFNALPGWNAIRSIREMMLYETKAQKDPGKRAAQAHQLLAFLGRNAFNNTPGYKPVLEYEAKILSDTFDEFVLHDHLGAINHPFYLHEFAQTLAEHDLQYVCDAELPIQYVGSLNEEASAALNATTGRIEKLQLLDFLSNQRFHSAILTRDNFKISGAIPDSCIFDYFVTLNAEPATKNPDTNQPIEWHKPAAPDENFVMGEKNINELLLELHCNGTIPIKIEDLIAGTTETSEDPESLKAAALKYGMELVKAGFVHAFAEPPAATPFLSEQPCAHPFTRFQAEFCPDAGKIMNAQRHMVETEKCVNLIVACCDGHHTQDQILDQMTRHLEAGAFTLNDRNDLPITDPAQQKMALQALVFETLTKLVNGNMFIS